MKKNKTNIILILVSFISFTQSCSKTQSPTVVPAPIINLPSITTSIITNVTSSSATGGGNVTNNGGSVLTSKGVVWSTIANPTIALSTKTNDGKAIGSFSSSINGLLEGTTYYVRAYASNSSGTSYGQEVVFKSLSNLPTVTTTAVSAITASTVITGGNVLNNGNSAIIARGVVWSTSTNPTIALSTKTIDGSSTGIFTSNVISLNSNTTYYLRAYATNSSGTSYGVELTFTTNLMIYAAGGISGNAFILRDGVETKLTNSSTAVDNNAIKSMFITSSNEYLVGYTGNTNYRYATVWLNGKSSTLLSSLPISQANSVCVSGTDVYIAGEEYNFGGYDFYSPNNIIQNLNSINAKIWKNGVAILLPTTSGSSGGAKSVYVNGVDVYVAGYENGPNGTKVAKLWKNGIGTNLVTPVLTNPATTFSVATSVFVSGTDVYVGGFQDNGNGEINAKLWKNGLSTSLSSGTNRSFVQSIFVNGTDVYAVGSSYGCSSYTSIATVWKNGIPIYLSDCKSQYGYGQSIYVRGSDIYVGGNVINFYENGTADNSNGYSRYTIWKNGSVFKQSSLGTQVTRLESIFIK